jgi:hypothetical protein
MQHLPGAKALRSSRAASGHRTKTPQSTYKHHSAIHRPHTPQRKWPSERQDVGKGSHTLIWARLVVLEMGEGARNGRQDDQGPLSEAR